MTTPSALLDLIFLPWHGYKHIFVTATSTGTLSFYMLTSNPTPRINHIHTHQSTATSILLTDLEAHPSIPGLIGYVTSSGLVSILNFNLDLLSSLNEINGDVSQHDLVEYHHSTPCADEGFEAWTLAFAPSPSPADAERMVGVYTGSDDSTLRRLDFVLADGSTHSVPKRISESDDINSFSSSSSSDDNEGEGTDSATLKILDRRSHSAGVVSILPLTLPFPSSSSLTTNGEVILTGSYDDHLRLLHRSSNSLTPQVRNTVLAETDLGGGVWRLRLMDETHGESSEWVVLASCMHAGARLVRIRRSVGGNWTIEVLARFEEHKSMNYGSDVQPSRGLGDGMEGRMRTVVSTSFYDRLMCLWRVEVDC